mgnify:CR=1 FL=1
MYSYNNAPLNPCNAAYMRNYNGQGNEWQKDLGWYKWTKDKQQMRDNTKRLNLDISYLWLLVQTKRLISRSDIVFMRVIKNQRGHNA